MDELTAVRKLREGFGPRHPEPSAALTERGPGGGRCCADPRCGWCRPASAAAVAGLVVTGAVPLGSDAPGSAVTASGRPGQAPTTLDARGILLAAAAAARSQPEQAPDPSRYVYSRVIGVEGTVAEPERDQDELWLSVDGRRPGLWVGTDPRTGKRIGADIPGRVPGPADQVLLRTHLRGARLRRRPARGPCRCLGCAAAGSAGPDSLVPGVHHR